MTDDILTMTGLVKRFGDFTAIDGIDLSVRPGKILALPGPNGCGKTTTLRMVSGLKQPTEGEIMFEDRVFVSVARGTYLTVGENAEGLANYISGADHEAIRSGNALRMFPQFAAPQIVRFSQSAI